jgi:cell division septation protein DedD
VDSTVLVERPTAAPGRRDEPAAERDAPGPPPGFYAIVGSARQSEGIRSLTASLEDAGFLTQVHRFRDEAGRTWYRGLVGPFVSRSEAEAASRQLLRERRLEAWVTEIGASGRPEEEPI